MIKLPKSLSSAKNIVKIFRYGDRERPLRDWLILSAAATILFVISLGWNTWVFEQVTNGEIVSLSVPAKTQISTGAVDTAQQVFQTRATERGHYLNDYRFVDPSH